jgi:hypothetical protein
VKAAGQALRTNVTQLVADENFDEAVALLQDLSLPHAEELSDTRNKLLAQVEGLARAAAERRLAETAARREENLEKDRERRARKALRKARTTFAEAAGLLLDGKTASAQRVADALTAYPDFPLVSNDVATALGMLQALIAMPDTIVKAYGEHLGTELPVEFSNGETVELAILGIEGATVKAKQPVGQGYVGRDFSIRDLSPREKWRRVADSGSPALPAMAGLLAAEAGYWDRAETYFSEVTNEIGYVFAEAVRERIAAAAPPPAEPATTTIVVNVETTNAIGTAPTESDAAAVPGTNVVPSAAGTSTALTERSATTTNIAPAARPAESE